MWGCRRRRSRQPGAEKLDVRGRVMTNRGGRGFALGVMLAALIGMPAFAASVAEVNARIDSVLGNSKRYEASINAFQQAVKEGHKEDVAAFIRYPIRVTIGGQKTVIRSPETFVQRYDAIMTPAIVGAIRNQNYGDLFVNDQGVMFGNGQAWLNAVCLDRKCDQSVIQVVTLQDAPAS